MPPTNKKAKKIEEPVGKNKKIGHPKRNSGYAEEQPVPSKKIFKKRSRRK